MGPHDLIGSMATLRPCGLSIVAVSGQADARGEHLHGTGIMHVCHPVLKDFLLCHEAVP